MQQSEIDFNQTYECVNFESILSTFPGLAGSDLWADREACELEIAKCTQAKHLMSKFQLQIYSFVASKVSFLEVPPFKDCVAKEIKGI